MSSTLISSVLARLFAPTFLFLVCLAQGTRVTYRIDEEVAIGMRVGNLLDQFDSINNRLRFLKMANPEDGSQYFTVGEFSGEISVFKRLDREALCSSQSSLIGSQCMLQMSVNCLQSSDPSASSMGPARLVDQVDVFIEIHDINDNGCQFRPSARQLVHLLEDARPGETRILLNLPHDPDGAEMGYSIQPDRIRLEYLPSQNSTAEQRFRLNVAQIGANNEATGHNSKMHDYPRPLSQSSGTEQNFRLELELIAELDYEQQKEYKLLVVAGDSSSNATYSCTLEVTIQVDDTNDHVPTFDRDVYTVDVEEYANLGHLIATVAAKDKDSGDNARIIYWFDPFTPEVALSTFSLNESSGAIRLERQLNYHRTPEYRLTIRASNPGAMETMNAGQRSSGSSGGRPFTAGRFGTTQLVVTVRDVNDQAPKIKMYSPTGSLELTIPEESVANQDVASISVTDDDSGENARISCELAYQSADGILRLGELNSEVRSSTEGRRPHLAYHSPGSGLLDKESPGVRKYKLVVEKSIDRERLAVVHFTLRCWDHGIPRQMMNQSSSLRVLDINDNAPLFPVERYVVNSFEDQHPERVKANYALIQVKASDLDEGENGRIRYSLDPETPSNLLNLLQVDPDTGWLSSTGGLDREQLPEFTLTIVAEDAGLPTPQTGSVKVHVRLLDVNDESPVFQRSEYIFGLRENQPIGQLVGVIYAADSDLGQNAEVTFRLEEASLVTPALQQSGAQRIMTQIGLNSDLVPPGLRQSRKRVMPQLQHQLQKSSLLRLVVKRIESTSTFAEESAEGLASWLSAREGASVYQIDLFTNASVDREALLSEAVSSSDEGTDIEGEELGRLSRDGEDLQHRYSEMLVGRMGFEVAMTGLHSSSTRLATATDSVEYDASAPLLVMHMRASDHGVPSRLGRTKICLRILDQNDNVPRLTFPDPNNLNASYVLVSYKELVGYDFTKVSVKMLKKCLLF
ncbi:unnamed protein product [Protopolystoma xenopodis]|uniref:Cadherin domain-containing protein n=1 Tax=Protopolystoma xenopodis TaxID=117903 RepID=A0A3S4ZMS7_9PLAT|nr:unnamed protein product [Protopolystoma xenopodis]